MDDFCLETDPEGRSSVVRVDGYDSDLISYVSSKCFVNSIYSRVAE